jgi:hypothetical protein
VRIGPNSLSFNTETALNTIYGSKNVNVKKSGFYLVLDSGAGTFTTHTEIDKEKHAAKRRVLSHAFSDSALRSAESFILENIVKWCSKIGPAEGQEWSEKRNVGNWSNWLGYDIMGELAFGQKFDCLNSEEYRHLPTALTEGAKFQYWVGIRLVDLSFVHALLGNPLTKSSSLVMCHSFGFYGRI